MGSFENEITAKQRLGVTFGYAATILVTGVIGILGLLPLMSFELAWAQGSLTFPEDSAGLVSNLMLGTYASLFVGMSAYGSLIAYVRTNTMPNFWLLMAFLLILPFWFLVAIVGFEQWSDAPTEYQRVAIIIGTCTSIAITFLLGIGRINERATGNMSNRWDIAAALCVIPLVLTIGYNLSQTP